MKNLIPTRYIIDIDSRLGNTILEVTEFKNNHIPKKWEIRRNGNTVLNKNILSFVYERIINEGSKEIIKNYRFNSIKSALKTYDKYLKRK